MCISKTQSILPQPRQRQYGLTLIELLMSIIIIGVAVVGILQVMAISSRVSPDPQLRKQALAIAEGLLEEVTLARFTYCDPTASNADTAANPAACASLPEVAGPEAGNTRPYDNVNDYVSAFGTATTYTTDAAGNTFPSGYSATVTINPDANLGPAGTPITPADGTSANMNVLRITVTVTYRGGAESIVLDGYRTRYAPNAVP